MRLKASLIFLVANGAFGQAPQPAPEAPTKSATPGSAKGKESAIRYMESGSGVVAVNPAQPYRPMPVGAAAPRDSIFGFYLRVLNPRQVNWGTEIDRRLANLHEQSIGNAIRGPLGVHRAVNRRYWFYGAQHDLEAQMKYLSELRRVTERQLSELIDGLALEEERPSPQPLTATRFDRTHFQILDHLNQEGLRRVGRNWVTQCPSCAAAGRDRNKDNLAISVEEPSKYLCWAGCSNIKIRAALGAPARLNANAR